MNNPFQEQFLKAGLVSQQQVKKANQQKSKKQRRQQKPAEDAARVRARQHAEQQAKQKAERDRELNEKRQIQARQKATSIEIDQLISHNLLQRGEGCDIAYNYEHRNKVHRIYVNETMRQQIIAGKLGIARIEGRYELVPSSIAEKIRQRNEKRIVLLEPELNKPDENDPYADFQVPDDLMW